MPGFIGDVVRIVARKRQPERKSAGVFSQPREGIAALEFFFQRGESGRGQVQRPAAVEQLRTLGAQIDGAAETLSMSSIACPLSSLPRRMPSW